MWATKEKDKAEMNTSVLFFRVFLKKVYLFRERECILMRGAGAERKRERESEREA